MAQNLNPEGRAPNKGKQKLFFDEAGQTGANLLDASQPVFALASVSVSSSDAESALAHSRGDEFHYSSVAKSGKGRTRIRGLLTSGLLNNSTASYAWVDKRFMLTSKVVSELVEPALAQQGLYIENGTTAYELASDLWDRFDENNDFIVIRRLYQDAQRNKPGALDSLEPAIRRFLKSKLSKENLHLAYLVGASALRVLQEMRYLIEKPQPEAPKLTPALPLFYTLCDHWSQSIGAFEIVHDEQHEVERWARGLASLLAEARHAKIPNPRGGFTQLPMQIDGISFSVSHESAELQIADLVAGAAAAVARAKIDASLNEADYSWGKSLMKNTDIEDWEVKRISRH